MFGRARVGEFLLNLLTSSTVTKYRARAALFDEGCRVHHWNWDALPEKIKTLLWQIFALTFMMEASRDVMAALQKLWPRKLVPPNMAPPLPESCYDGGDVHGCSLPSLLIGILLEFCGMLDIVEALNGSDHLRFAGAIADHDSRQMGKWEVVQVAAALFANSQGNCSCEPPTCGRRFFDLVADIPTGSKGSVEVS